MTNDGFGFSVSISDSGTLVVGASSANKAYVYYGCTSSLSSTCNDYNRIALTGPANSNFGYSVSVNADKTIVVGAPLAGNGVGAAYIYYGMANSTSKPSGN